jgi:hypothetical protein
MSDLIASRLDTHFQTGIDVTIVASLNDVRDEWRQRERSVKARLETIRREREAAEAEIRSMEDSTKHVFDYLVGIFPVDRVRPTWEAQGELVPPSIRGLLGELRGPSQPLPSPTLPDNDTRQQSSRAPASDDTMEEVVTVSVETSETSRESSPSVR